ncbi:MAG TPA: WYL domain-containing protein [Propionicimonas sp.]|nr:WYL domain-containing protein [Propionicimonas sp.]HQA77515.1 WYL domain-containing protein [Propionicimonas sp.]HQD96104.1 WYL domain-containing protein [Propionicimonas sp.]
MNLAICLLMARRFIEKTQIREVVEGYHDLSDAAFERTFERDKDELRAMGVPVETGSNNPLFPDDVGYRIRRKDFELPAIEFTPAETAALGLAATVWESATQAEHAISALAKLRAAGVDPDPQRLAGLAPSIGAREPAFASIWAATGARTPIRFDYRGQTRTVEPWAMTYRRGAWYLYGRDRAKGEPRMFKVARLDAPAVPAGKPASYTVPELDLEAAWRSLEPSRADASAIVAIKPGRAADLRRRATPTEGVYDVPSGYEPLRVSYSRVGDFVGELCAYGADALVLKPLYIRRAVIAQLAAVAGGK